MPGRPSDRPPPDIPPSTRRRWWRRRGAGERRGLRPGTDPAYERSDAAEQERVITEALSDLRDMDVREVMTPRVDVVALTIPVSATDVARAVRESGHSCFPVVDGELDDVVGVLYVNDLFRSRRSGKAGLLSSVASEPEREGLSPIEISRRVRQAYVVPESRPILAALVEMRRHRRGFAVVVDEYGGVSGVLTVKDLLEPIVGDLHDELDPDDEQEIVRVDGSRWLIDGQTNVDEVRERLGIEVPEGDYVTLGGYLFDGLGHIPAAGECLPVDGWELSVQEMDKRRIAKVVARKRGSDELGAGRTGPAPDDTGDPPSVSPLQQPPPLGAGGAPAEGSPPGGPSRSLGYS